MAKIRFNCPQCLDVEIDSSNASRFTWERQPEQFDLFYRFGCSVCKTIVVTQSDGQVDELLSAAGVSQTSEITFPYSEVQDPVRYMKYPPYNSLADHAVDFHDLMQQHTNLADIARGELRDVSGL